MSDIVVTMNEADIELRIQRDNVVDALASIIDKDDFKALICLSA
jgi:hypothetical protein